jgi:hypothetical protein
MKKNIKQFIQKFKLLRLLINSLLLKVIGIFKSINIKKLNIKLPNLKHLFPKLLNRFKFFDLAKVNLKIANITNLFVKSSSKVQFYNIKKSSLKISNFNKILILFITILFGYLFYLTIPNIYNKLWVQQTVEKKLIEEFNINFNLSSEISYVILPSPHFLIKNAIIVNEPSNEIKKIADIKKLKVFISQKNFFQKNKLTINKVLIERANFLIRKDNFNYITNLINQKFSLKNITIKKSNLFLKNSEDDTLLINKIDNAQLFYDSKKLQNILSLKGELFNIPFLANLNNDLINKELDFNAESKKLKLRLNNKLNKKNNTKSGSTEILFLNTKLIHEYTLKNKLFEFVSKNSTLPNNIINYSGQIDLKPFNLNLVIDIEKVDLLKIVNKDSVIIELIKSEIFFNDNINLLISLKSPKVQNHKILKNLVMNLKVDQGMINLDSSKFELNKMGSLELNESNINFIDGELVLSGNLIINLNDSMKFFQFLQTPKKIRQEIKQISVNFGLNIQKKELQLNSFLIDDLEPHEEVAGIMSSFNSEKNTFNNFIEFKKFMNRLLIAYKG